MGAATVLAFAPWQWFGLALITPGLLEHRLITHTPKQAGFAGFLFGLGFFGFGVSWVFLSIHDYSDAPLIVGLLITAGLVVLLSAFIWLTCYLYRRLLIHPTVIARLLIFPAVWTLIEAFRGWFLTGFPWLYMGYSLIDTPMAGYAPVIGVYGLSFLCVVMSMLLFLIIYHARHIKLAAATVFALLIFVGFGLQKMTWTTPTNQSYRVALLQGNIPQEMKWDPIAASKHFLTYHDLTQSALNNDIIIWPEASLPVALPYGNPYLDVLDEMVRPGHNALVLGVLDMQDDDFHTNSLKVLGDGEGDYDKYHLVPFGEYVPYHAQLGDTFDWLGLPMAYTLPGQKTQPPLQVKKWKVGSLICYEVVYPSLAASRAKGSDVLLTVSNDTWFGRSIGPLQHFQMARMRALETGRYLLRATNNGISGIIDDHGKPVNMAEPYTSTHISGRVPGMQGDTPLVIIGHETIIIFMLILLGIGVIITRKD